MADYPTYDESKTVEDEIEIALQVCGKFKGTTTVPREADKDTMLTAAKSDARVAAALEGKTVVKEIVVPGKLVNIVVK